MKRILKTVFPLLVSLFAIMISNGFYMTFASLRVSLEGTSNLVVGIINSAYYAGLMFGSLFTEKLIERNGHIRSFVLFASLNSLAVLAQSALLAPIYWVIFRFIIGMCCAAYFLTIESWLLLCSTVATRGKILSLYMLVVYAGQGCGQFLLNYLSIKTMVPFLVTTFLCAFAVIPLVMQKGSDPIHVDSSTIKIKHLFKRSPLGVLGCFIAGLILSSFYGLGPIFAKDSNLETWQISQIMGFTIIGGLFLQWPFGHLSDIFDRPKVLVASCFLLIGICTAIFLLPHAPYYLLLAMCILYGGISFTLYPLSISYTCDNFSPYLIIRITCSLLIVYGVGCVFGPIIAAYLMDLTRASGLFLYCGVLAAVLMILGIYRIASGKTVNEEDQGEYIPLPRTSSLVNYLYPRSEGTDLEEDDDEDE